jgi:hypothetical protein
VIAARGSPDRVKRGYGVKYIRFGSLKGISAFSGKTRICL